MQNHTFSPTSLGLAIAAVSMFTIAHGSLAAQSQAGLEEITVTAQKRSQTLSDVPISITVVDSSRIKAGNINKIADIGEFAPNISMTETGISTQMYIRGIGSGNNQAFEQSVGQYVDGIYYSRQQQIRAPFLDLERVEVLRGPQGTLLGKNSIAGALNLTTAKPTADVQVSVNALYEFESNQQEYTGILSGPLADNFRARLVYRGYQEDGYILNTLKNNIEPQRDEDAVRLTMDWDITDKLSASLKIENDTFDTKGRQIEIVRDDPNLFPAGSTPIAGLNFSGVLRAFGQPVMDTKLDFQRQANANESSNTDMDNVTLTLDYDMNGYTLTSITGNVKYNFDELCDCDYTPSNIFEVTLGEDYEQFSQEIRLSSPAGASIEWLAGAYLQNSEMSSREGFTINSTSLLGTLAATSTNPAQKALAAVLNTRILRRNEQENDAWALFAQGTWNLSTNLRLTLGGRFNNEEKSAFRDMNLSNLTTGGATASPAAPVVYVGAFKIYTQQGAGMQAAPGVFLPGHSLRGKRKENQFTPLVNLQWDLNEQSMVYASATKGYKAGGFDARANNPFSFEFEEESATSFEIGEKTRLLDGALEVNSALFFTNYDNLQVSQYDGTLGFNVGNAKETKVKGLELDGRWAATDDLTVAYAYSWLDFEFTDFKNGNCYNRQVSTGAVVNGVALCNYTGMRGQYTPKHSMSLSFDHVYALSNGLILASSLMYNFRGEQNVHDNLDPKMLVDATSRINLRVGLESDRWQVAFVGKNLSDEEMLTYAGNVPLSGSTFGTNSYYGFVDRGRQLALEAGYKF